MRQGTESLFIDLICEVNNNKACKDVNKQARYVKLVEFVVTSHVYTLGRNCIVSRRSIRLGFTTVMNNYCYEARKNGVVSLLLEKHMHAVVYGLISCLIRHSKEGSLIY